nr:hypothetical protein [Pyrinomonadaceae bacterium]
VRVRLLSVPEGKQLWAGQFDEQFTDVFAVQDEVAEKMAGALALKLTSEEREQLTKRYTDDCPSRKLKTTVILPPRAVC